MELYPTGRTRLTDKTLDNLLTRLAKGHTFIPRLRAEADSKYYQNDPMLGYLFNYYGFLDVLIEDLTSFLEELDDSWSTTSTKGKLGYQRKVKARDQLNLEIAEYEAKYKSMALAQSQ